ncbi:MAG: T9SS type A sorting domain-containing protein, partial [Ignavibacteriaceae bacterium]|nr:T9SS type A sorting domain-containing protein [Ignavibacteriaceae bacterium]
NQGFYVESSLDRKNWTENGFVAGSGTTTELREYSYSVPFNGTRNLYFRLRQMDFDGTFNYSNIIEVSLNPYEFSLSQNYPNPFNPATTINFTLPTPQNVSLDIFNSAGEKVATIVNESLQAGYHSINFNASKLSSGIYFYSIKAGDFVAVRKMILLK